MSIPSNMYAEKVFAEHPLALWALDDGCDYISLLSEADATIAENPDWMVTYANPTIFDNTTSPYSKMPDSPATKLTTSTNYVSGDAIAVEFSNNSVFSSTNSTFTIGFYIYASKTIESVDISYTLSGSVAGTKQITLGKLASQKWNYVSATFENNVSNAGLKIKIWHKNKSQAYFIINGMTIGNMSEEFNMHSLGKSQVDLPVTLNISGSGYKVIEAPAYGLQDLPGYYLGRLGKSFVRDSTIPLVFGASNASIISQNTIEASDPSLVFPGMGFLSDAGKYSEYTFEAWLRFNAETDVPRRIIGPIASEDGLYVDGAYLVIRIGNNVAYHYVGQWGRPMFVQMQLSSGKMSLLLNGEVVSELSYVIEDETFPEKFSTDNKEQDWIGFYAYSDIPTIEIDCVAIYSYVSVPDVTMRRFVFGQGVQFPENLNIVNGGRSVFVDYKMSQYSGNYSYPVVGNWKQATYADNMDYSNGTLSGRTLIEPELVIKDNEVTKDFWISNYATIMSINDSRAHMKFESLSDVIDRPSGIYVLFKRNDMSELNSTETLLTFVNKITDETLKVSIDMLGTSGTITYQMSNSDTPFSTQEVVMLEEPSTSNLVVVGLNIEKFILSGIYGADTFFSSLSNISVYIGGEPDFSNCSTSIINKIGVLSSRSLNKISNLFNANGSFDAETNGNSNSLEFHMATHTTIRREHFGKQILAVDSNSYWEDAVSLSMLSKPVIDATGSKVSDIDTIQFNIDYPEPSITGFWSNYDMSHKDVRIFVTLQSMLDGAAADVSGRTISELTNANYVNILSSQYQTHKYEVVNGSVISLPKDVNLQNMAIVVHIDMRLKNANKKNVAIRRLELASRSLNYRQLNPIGTRHGIDLTTKKEVYANDQDKGTVPVVIDKNPVEYLYLTNQSGIRVYDWQYSQSGIYVDLNKNATSTFNIASMQMSLRFNGDEFPNSQTPIFTIYSSGGEIPFHIERVNGSGTRAKITTSVDHAVTVPIFFWNGEEVMEPVVTAREWGMLGIQFNPIIDFGSQAGSIAFHGMMNVNNLSYYQADNLETQQTVTSRTWNMVLLSDWEYWSTAGNEDGVDNWKDLTLLDAKEKIVGLSPADAFDIFVGTNKVIVDDIDGVIDVGIGDYEYSLFIDVKKQNNVLKAT